MENQANKSPKNNKSRDYYEYTEYDIHTERDIHMHERDIHIHETDIHNQDIFYGIDLEPQYRSMTMMKPNQVHTNHDMMKLSTQFKEEKKGTKDHQMGTSNRTYEDISQELYDTFTSYEKPTNPITVFNKPRYVGPSYFICNLLLDEIISHVNTQLTAVHEITYSFVPEKCMWNVVYLRGAVRCEFEIFVYQDNDSFAVNANRLSGDGMAFHTVFRSLKGALCSTETSPSSTATDPEEFYMPLPPTKSLLQDETLEALRPIIAMAKCGMADSRTESAKILCDLSFQRDLHPLMSESGCVKALIGLIKEDYQYCNQHALCALANLSSSLCCREQLVEDRTFLSDLLELTRDGSYSCAEMRRECARMLANLSEAQATSIIDAVGVDQASNWVRTVDTMRDDRLRLHAERAKKFLQPCI
mmetsp:Transcript_7183/g.10683  ORF Transcript_7183/g.10683 Transcript_7183/m.10683 type:complete len:416 (+) Transcript_7183:223-1470(+)|eukprot:CAMPEP_0185027956 /NCGR_PEP_ID=MMETSP1103-20130426/13327_1 /TAXON_ID=36769 /ORGANISM="Paraphysomonas bandaiensis, Strain Caron Lab Isolate" /LENGTH=415 /DNA_ID=CAMNT_0027562169 /DNA_START=189 /DNA_END=1436 /DNA_ORIENTATION=+